MHTSSREWEYITKLAETGSFSAAAEKLFISQPSLSQFIRRIEKQMGTPLFERRGNGVILTEAGRIYLAAEEKVREIYRERDSRIQDLQQTVSGTVRIGSSYYRSATILAAVFPLLHKTHPHISIQLSEGTTRELEEDALEGRTDFSIVLHPFFHAGLAYEELFREELLLALPEEQARHYEKIARPVPYSQYPAFDYHLLGKEPFIVIKEGQKLRQNFYEFTRKAAISPPVVLESNDMVTALTLASVGVGATIIPQGRSIYSRLPAQPRYYTLRQYTPDWNVAIAYKKGRYLSQATRSVIDIIHQESSRIAHAGKGIGQ